MKLKKLAQVVSLICIAGPALAQTTPADPPTPPKPPAAKTEKIEVTGSSIKRVQDEGALPLQVITREDIARLGITSAEQLISTLGANGNGIDNMTTQQGADFLSSTSSRSLPNNGSASASLRGFGPQYTLILLNGRRIATHGLSGKSVDLNAIPLAAIERVEVLKDGASAIYGTDAIGGVINFILRKDVQGLEGTAFADRTQHKNGDITRVSLLGGIGDLAKDGYNVMASLTFDTNNRLRGSQRDFQNGNQPDRGLAPDTTGTPVANIGIAGGTALSSNIVSLPGFPPLPGTTYNRLGLLALQGKCDSVPGMSLYRGDVTGNIRFGMSCAFDYGKEWSLMQPVDRTNLVTRGTLELSAEHRLVFEAVGSRIKSAVEYTPIQLTALNYPAFITVNGASVRSPYYQDLTGIVPGFNNQLPERVRWRCLPCGPRQQNTTTEAYRLFTGLEGVIGGWDYKLGLSSSQSEANTTLGDGNMYIDKINAAVTSGLVNVFRLPGQPQTQQEIDTINAAKATGLALFGGKAFANEFDGSLSKEIYALPAGPLSLALGFDARKEEFTFNKADAAAVNINGVQSPASLNKVSRDIKALYTELQVPVVKNLDLQLAVRQDRYNDFGSTTNPKVAFRWAPLQELVFRGSYSTGFHAPDFDALYGGDTVGQFNSDINDPVTCPTGRENNAGCGIRPQITGRSNKNLKAEKSKQYSVGFLAQPTPWLSGSIDFWKIDLTDRVGALSGLLLVTNYQQYAQYVIRDATGQISNVIAPTFNLAGDRSTGADVNLTGSWKSGIGNFVAAIDGTYTKSYQTRFSSADPWVDLVGKFGDTTYGYNLHLRWKHTARLTWTQGPWSTTLSQVYSSGYSDEVGGYVGFTPPQLVGAKVSSYTLYNLIGTYRGFKDLTVTAGIRNLFDTKPPFSGHNVDNVAGAGWDARVGDPRLRSFVLGLNYKFK